MLSALQRLPQTVVISAGLTVYVHCLGDYLIVGRGVRQVPAFASLSAQLLEADPAVLTRWPNP